MVGSGRQEPLTRRGGHPVVGDKRGEGGGTCDGRSGEGIRRRFVATTPHVTAPPPLRKVWSSRIPTQSRSLTTGAHTECQKKLKKMAKSCNPARWACNFGLGLPESFHTVFFFVLYGRRVNALGNPPRGGKRRDNLFWCFPVKKEHTPARHRHVTIFDLWSHKTLSFFCIIRLIFV